MSADVIPFPIDRCRGVVDTPGDARTRESAAITARVQEIASGVAHICRTELDAEYERLCRELLDEAVAIDPNVFARGRVEIWSSAIVHCVGAHNNLFHAWFGPRLAASELAEIAGASMPSINNRSKQLRELVGLDDPSSVGDRFHRQTPDSPRGFAALLERIGEPRIAPVDVLAERLSTVDGFVASLEVADAEIEPTAPVLAADLRAHADRMRILLDAAVLGHADVDEVCEPVMALLQLAHELSVRIASRAVLDPVLFEELGSSAVPVAELALAAFEEEFTAFDPPEVNDALVTSRRFMLHAIMAAVARGVLWARRTSVAAPPWVSDELHHQLRDCGDELEMYEILSLGIAPPLAVLTYNIVDSIAIDWSTQLPANEGRLLDQARDHQVAGLSRDHDPDLEGAFDLGVAYAFVESILDSHTSQVGARPIRAIDAFAWLAALDGDAPPDDRPATQVVRTHELTVALDETNPPIWRRIRVDSTITLADLHSVLQAAMGWTNSHLHEFTVDETRYCDPRLCEPIDDDERFLDTRATRLCDVAPVAGSAFTYHYDFGDSWEHLIVVDAVAEHAPADRNRVRRPMLVDGARACPPEDCGGTSGFERMLASLADSDDEEHDSFVEWLGGGFHAATFDSTEFDERLAWLRRQR